MQSMHFLASVATSVWWLFLTTALWVSRLRVEQVAGREIMLGLAQGIATGLFHNTRMGGICDGLPPISRWEACRRYDVVTC